MILFLRRKSTAEVVLAVKLDIARIFNVDWRSTKVSTATIKGNVDVGLGIKTKGDHFFVRVLGQLLSGKENAAFE